MVGWLSWLPSVSTASWLMNDLWLLPSRVTYTCNVLGKFFYKRLRHAYNYTLMTCVTKIKMCFHVLKWVEYKKERLIHALLQKVEPNFRTHTTEPGYLKLNKCCMLYLCPVLLYLFNLCWHFHVFFAWKENCAWHNHLKNALICMGNYVVKWQHM